MPSTITSDNMSLPIPIQGVQTGPNYALNVNACLSLIDSHDHSAGKGVPVTPAGLNINSSLSFVGNDAVNLRSTRFSEQDAVLADPADLRCLYAVDADLYFNDGNGNNVRITQSGGVAGSPGSIANLTSPASASYVSADGTFVWESAANKPAHMDAASYIFRNFSVNSYGLTLQAPAALAADYDLTLPTVPLATSFVTLNASGEFGASVALSQGITRSMQEAVGQQISSSSSNFNTASATPVDVTNLSVTITTTGRPVVIALIPDGSTQAYLRVEAASGTASQQLDIVRGSTTISSSRNDLTASGGLVSRIPVSSIWFLDPVAAGTYTYKIQTALLSGIIAYVANAKLVAYEL